MKTHNIKSTILTNEVYIQYFNICVHWCRFLQLFHLAGTLNSNSPLPLPLTHGDHLSTLCFCEFGYFRSLMSVKSCSICPSVTGFTSHSIMSSWFLQGILCARLCFRLKAERYSLVCAYHLFCSHSSLDGRFGCFHILFVSLVG